MESALIITHTEKSTDLFSTMLTEASIETVITLHSCAEARRLLLERDFDLVIINAPLRDESGEGLSRYIAANGLSQVILVVKSEYFEAVSAMCETDGVLTIAKPMNKAVLWSALHLARAAHNRLLRMHTENRKLKQKMEDIRIVDRAKYILISNLNINEQEAHRYIEKRAMDMRQTKRVVAEEIMKHYEN